jgi:phage terminase large subunit
LEEVGQVAVDVIGMGAGVADYLRNRFARDTKPGEENIVVDVNAALPVDDGVNKNLRMQMWDNALEWLKAQPCSLPNDPDFKAELCSPTYYFRGGLRLLESKEDMKKRGVKSPNKADAFTATFAVPVAPKLAPQPYTRPWTPLDPGVGL